MEATVDAQKQIAPTLNGPRQGSHAERGILTDPALWDYSKQDISLEIDQRSFLFGHSTFLCQ